MCLKRLIICLYNIFEYFFLSVTSFFISLGYISNDDVSKFVAQRVKYVQKSSGLIFFFGYKTHQFCFTYNLLTFGKICELILNHFT